MQRSETFAEELKKRGANFFVGVPCSLLTGVTSLLEANDQYVTAASEAEAVAIAAGAHLSGRNPVIFAQNSGLGNMVNGLTSLVATFGLSALLVISVRGHPGFEDEPQHRQMGAITSDLLDLLAIPWALAPTEPERLITAVQAAMNDVVQKQTVSALLIPPGLFQHSASTSSCEYDTAELAAPIRDFNETGSLPTRADAIATVARIAAKSVAIVSTTGKTSRELFTLADDERNFYMVGSMGSASSIALGVALTASRPVLVLDGDGAALMRLGALVTVARYRPAALTHILLDNGVHDSTGGQSTGSQNIDFPKIASACGYRAVYQCSSIHGLERATKQAMSGESPSFVHVRVRAGAMQGLGRPAVSPLAVAARFKEFLRQGIP